MKSTATLIALGVLVWFLQAPASAENNYPERTWRHGSPSTHAAPTRTAWEHHRSPSTSEWRHRRLEQERRERELRERRERERHQHHSDNRGGIFIKWPW